MKNERKGTWIDVSTGLTPTDGPTWSDQFQPGFERPEDTTPRLVVELEREHPLAHLRNDQGRTAGARPRSGRLEEPKWWKRVQDEQRPILGMPVRNPDGTYSMPTEPPEFPTDGKGAFVFQGLTQSGKPIMTFETEDPYKNPDGTRSVTPHIKEDLLIEPTADGTRVTKITAKPKSPAEEIAEVYDVVYGHGKPTRSGMAAFRAQQKQILKDSAEEERKRRLRAITGGDADIKVTS